MFFLDEKIKNNFQSSQFSVVKKTEQDAHYDKYINQLQKVLMNYLTILIGILSFPICVETQKLKHGEVSKIASELTENFGASLQLKVVEHQP